MDCKEVRGNLVAFVDGELPPEKMKEIERHLGKCPDCEREHRKLAKFTTSIVELLEPLRPARTFKESVLTTVTTHERRGIGLGPTPERRGWPKGWLLAVLGALIIASMFGAAVLVLRPALPAGRLVVEKGSAKVLSYRRGRWAAVPGRDEICPGERVGTSPESRAVVRLEGASVTLGGSTTVQIESTREVLRIHFASQGELYAEVNILREFQVVAQDVRVTLAGGAANLKLLPDGALVVSACKGALRIDSPENQIGLAEGKELAVPQRGRPPGEPVDIPEGRLDWLKLGEGKAAPGDPADQPE